MFDYLVTPHSPSPRLVLEQQPAPPGRVVRHLEESRSLVVELPTDPEGLSAARSGRFWKDLRRRERRFQEAHGALRFRAVSDPAELRAALPLVRELFAARWDGLYTTLPWRRDDGFAPYATALVDLASKGEAELVLLEGADRLLAFSWLFLQPPWCYCWQHAATREEPFPRYGLGTILDVRTFEHLVGRGDIHHYDFMVGDAVYKREWGAWERPVYLRLEAPDTVIGRLQLRARTRLHTTRIALRDGDPRRYEAIKRAMHRVERVTAFAR